MNRFNVILIDPPWAYRDRREGRGGCSLHYSTMTLEQIHALPVASLAARDACLFLWATSPMLRAALGVMRLWGFEFKTVAFAWVKRGESGKLAWGNGAYTRANVELCLLGTRGRPTIASHAVHQVIEAPRGEHSAKPPEVRDRIVQLCGDVPRVELFAREAVPGWSSWGAEAPSADIELARQA